MVTISQISQFGDILNLSGIFYLELKPQHIDVDGKNNFLIRNVLCFSPIFNISLNSYQSIVTPLPIYFNFRIHPPL